MMITDGRYAPVKVVKSMITAYPKAASKQNALGSTPLHEAFSWPQSSDEVKKIILLAYPDATRLQDSNGRLPLHYAWKNTNSVASVQMLLQQYPTAVVAEDIFGKTPLVEMVNWFMVTHAFLRDDNANKNNSCWQKLSLMLFALHCGSSRYIAPYHPFLFSLRLGFPIQLLRFILDNHSQPNSLQHDHYNRLLFVTIRILASQQLSTSDSAETAQKKSLSTISSLLHYYPSAAASPNPFATYSLHFAIRHGFSWNNGLNFIVDAAPFVVELPGPLTCLYPFAMAAVSSNLETVYMLLKRAPHLLRTKFQGGKN